LKGALVESVMAAFGNTCALICRVILVLVLLYGIVLSCMIVPSCHFISALTHNEETHGVGLETFENESGECVPHNSFVVKNYNGMETVARICAYVAPACGAVAVILLLVECCKADGILCGKCLPGILLLGTVVCQGLTFLLFQSDLFCSNKDIERCKIGEAGYRSIQACLVYALCTVFYCCCPAPMPCHFSPPTNKAKQAQEPESKKKKLKPDKGGDWTKEMYEQRRKEKKDKSRGVSGRKKDEILDELKDKGGRKGRGRDRDGSKGGSSRDSDGSYDKHREKSLTLYVPDGRDRRKDGARSSRSSSPKYDNYVDTEPDGMDWSAYTPDKREAHYERQRLKKRERERERRRREEEERTRKEEERTRKEEWERGGGGRHIVKHRGSGRGGGEDYSYDDGGGYDDGYGRRDSYYSAERNRGGGGGRGYEMSPYGGNGRDDRDRYRDDDYDDSFQSSRDDSRDYGGRGGGGGGRDRRRRRDDEDYSASYRDDDYSYAQDSYRNGGNDPPSTDDVYSYYESRRGGGGGRRSDHRRSSHNDSYSTYDDTYDRSRGSYA